MEKNEPENFARIQKIMLPKDYLAYRLSGSFCTDVSDASGMLLLDVKNRCWSKEMLEICHVREEQLPKLYESWQVVGTLKPEIAQELGFSADVKNRCWSKEMLEICHVREEQLPKLYESWQVVGTLKPEIAQELGFSADVKVVAGAGDNAAAAVGTGTVGDGQCNISLGTSGTIFISSKEFGVDENNALHSFDHADGSYHLMGCMLSAASCNKWWAEEILGTKDFAKEQEGITNALHSFDHADGSYHLMGCMLSAASCNKWWAEEILGTKDFAKEQEGITKLGENHVFFLPYLMGERSPHNNPDARGVFFGMSMDTTRADMTQAVLEGVAFGLRDSLEVARSLGIKIERTKICGGGAKSPLWKKIIAMTQAVLEGVAFGLRDSLEVARSLGIKIERTKICGGGAKSPLWKKIIANVMNLKVDVLENEEGPSMGGAMLAAVGCGAYPDVETIGKKFAKVVDTVEPEEELVAKYEEWAAALIRMWKPLERSLQKWWIR